MKAGTYILEAESAYYTFEPVTAVIDSETESLPDLVADRVQVCGKIDVDKSEMEKYSGEKRIVMIKSKQEYSEQKMQANNEGVFCTEVKMGEYTVTPIINLDESSYELHLTPESFNIKVDCDPINDLKFTQIKVSISGEVKLLEKDESQKITVALKGKNVPEKTAKVKNGKFELTSILPGKYEISIDKPDFCWKESIINIDIKNHDIKNINFIQTGYALQYYSEKDINVQITGETSAIHLSSGDNSYCLKSKGIYEITPIGCYKFEKSTITYNTNSSAAIKFIPEEYLIEGYLESKDSSLKNLDEFVTISYKINSKETPIKIKKEEKDHGKYLFQFYSHKDAEVEIRFYFSIKV